MKKTIKFVRLNFFLILICLLFLGTRFFRISEIPSSVYWDEASIGYNAYSVLKTGRDEWGNFLPLHFRAFGEFKLPVFVYATSVSEIFFGLNSFAVRFPSVVFGLLGVVGLYFVVIEVTKNKTISLLSMFIFSISPWFFIFSRTGYEAVGGLCFFIWGIYLFLKFRNGGYYVIFSIISFLLSSYSYNSFRILVIPVFMYIFLYFLLKKKFMPFLLSSVFILLSIIPIYKLYTKDSGLGRLNTLNSSDYIGNYFKNFDSNYLFIKGDTNPRSQMPNFGQLYLVDSVLVLSGLIFIFLKTKKENVWYLLFPLFLILAPIPAAITKENPHALRSILMAPILAAISGIGAFYLSEIFVKYKKYLVALVVIIYALSFENYFYTFANEYNNLASFSWQYEYKEIFKKQKTGCVEDKYGQPYIFALFYNKVEPQVFWDTKELNNVSDWGFSTVKSFGDYTFEKKCE